MSESETDSAIRTAVGRRTVKSVAKVLGAAAAVVFLLYLASLLPGIDRLLPAAPISLGAAVSAIAAAAVAALLLYVAPGLAALTRLFARGPKDVVENLAAIVHWLVVLVAVLVAHRGIEPAASALVDGRLALYDAVFLLLALPPLSIVAARLYVTLDPAADLVADRLVGDEPDESEA